MPKKTKTTAAEDQVLEAEEPAERLQEILAADADVQAARKAHDVAREHAKGAKETLGLAEARRDSLLHEAREGLPLLDGTPPDDEKENAA